MRCFTNWVWVILYKKKIVLGEKLFFLFFLSLGDFTLGDKQVIERWIFFLYQQIFISLQFCFYSGDHV